jgi:hypothetical protein
LLLLNKKRLFPHLDIEIFAFNIILYENIDFYPLLSGKPE